MSDRERRNQGDYVDVGGMLSLKNWGTPPEAPDGHPVPPEVAVDCGWGRLIFGQTFDDARRLVQTLCEESDGERDVAMYVRDPHVLLSLAPQELFLDPSHTCRLDLTRPQADGAMPAGLVIREGTTAADEEAVNRICQARGMVPVRRGFLMYDDERRERSATLLVACLERGGDIVGMVTGVDHAAAINDPDNGSSLWALAVDPQCPVPGVGQALVLALAARFRERGRRFMDLSVMHDNDEAMARYRKLGFEQVPVYCVKRKNPINERLFIGEQPESKLNVYARIIVDEARRRGIGVEVLDAEGGFFALVFGGRRVVCRESLSELTSAVAMSRCDDKSVTRRALAAAGLPVTEQLAAADAEEAVAFLGRHGRIVVKPARGEQGRGVCVDLTDPDEVRAAFAAARALCDQVIVEKFVPGQDLRIIVIDGRIVAGAVRKPPMIVGDGRRTVRELIEGQSRRRAAATGGESRIPLDEETERTLRGQGVGLDDTPEEGMRLLARKTANLHTGGIIKDVTDRLHPALCAGAKEAARALDIPVVGLDFLVPAVDGPDYVIIEANERPGLANHEPQPTAQRFIDLLFPQTRAA